MIAKTGFEPVKHTKKYNCCMCLILQVGLEPTISRLSAECINRLCYCSKKFPRRESHSLEPEGTGFTDPPAYFNGLLRIKMEDPRVELGLKDFQSSARTGYTNLPNQDTFYSCRYQFCYFRNLMARKMGLEPI